MILVVLGTHELPFTRLLDEIQRCRENGDIQERVLVQNGHTAYQSDAMELLGFISYNDMNTLYDEARLIITHAGTGSVTMGLKKQKPVIAVPRLAAYGEHNDDHQLQLIQAFVSNGFILSWGHHNQSFESVLHEAERFAPKPFSSNNTAMFNLIQNFIDKA